MSYDSRRYALLNRWDRRHEATLRRLTDLDRRRRILEVGCGQGYLTRRLAAWGHDVVGIDANRQAAEVAETDLVRYMLAERLDFPDAVFDLVVSVHAIEHIPDLAGAMREMARVLEPGGEALLVYPAEPVQGLFAIPTAVILHGNPLKARQVHCQWLWPSRVRRLMEPRGFVHRHSEFNLLSSPQFVSVFVRE